MTAEEEREALTRANERIVELEAENARLREGRLARDISDTQAMLATNTEELGSIRAYLMRLRREIGDTLGGLQLKADGTTEDLLEAAQRVAARVVALEVEAYVGVKITPAERDTFIRLAKMDRPLFEKMIEERSDMGLIRTAVVPPAEIGRSNATADENGEGLAALLTEENEP